MTEGAHVDEVAFVTGFPSSQARYVVGELVDTNPSALVYAVVRDKTRVYAEKWLSEVDADTARRVVLLRGDALSLDFGLSGLEFNALTRDVTHIYHFAQATSPSAPRELAERVNLGGTREAIELGRACSKLRCLCLSSTAFVCGDREGVVREDELLVGQKFRNVYEDTKARAEQMLERIASELPVAVVRPPMVVGRSADARVERLDGLYLYIALMLSSPPELTLPLLAPPHHHLHVVPVDYLARAAVAIGREPLSVGRTFHVVDPSPPTVRDALEQIANLGGRKLSRSYVPANVARIFLSAPGLNLLTKTPRALFETLASDVSFDRTNASFVSDARAFIARRFRLTSRRWWSSLGHVFGRVARRVEGYSGANPFR